MMMPNLILCGIVAAAASVLAAPATYWRAPRPVPAVARQAPTTDVFLAPLRREGDRLIVGTVRNLTARDGYDNQPSWSPDSHWLYFTSIREDGQADIYRIEPSTGTQTRVTSTVPESEYSATVTPDGRAISVVRVERDSTQRLWRFPLDGGAPAVLLENVRPVGYHAWVDANTVALFVLGSPNSLQLADLRTGRADTITTGIGRSLHRVPGEQRISFVHRTSADEAWLTVLDPATRTTERVVRLPAAGDADVAWTPDGLLLMGDGSTLRAYDRRAGEWQAVADLSGSGLSSISRLAVSPRGDAVAIVAVPALR